jgi:hypothetical protein
LVMRYIIIYIGILKCDFQIECLGTVKQVYLSKVRFVRLSWCSISDYREQHEQFVCSIHCSL